MSAPKLTRKLILEKPLRVPDGAGGYTETWGAAGIMWGEVLPRGSGREIIGESRLKVRITVRAAGQAADSRPEPRQRFRDGARVFDIEAVTEEAASGRFLVCFATEEIGA